jgi:hypothetical protein
MNAERRILPGMVLLTLLVLGPALFGQSFPKGRQVPPLPRTWDQGLGSWASVGLGPAGFAAAFSRQFERSVVTLRSGIYLWNPAFAGADVAATIGLPLSRGRVFASAGGGLGCMVGKITGGIDEDLKVKAAPCLAADLQLSLRLTSRLGLGLYAPFGLSTKRFIGGIFLCLQFGRWEP